MLPKRNRLGRSQALREVIRRGKRISSPFFTLKLLRSSGPINRFAISIPSKSAKRATVRNQLRRKLFSMLEEFRASKTQRWDVYITVHAPATKATHKELTSNFSQLLSHIRTS